MLRFLPYRELRRDGWLASGVRLGVLVVLLPFPLMAATAVSEPQPYRIDQWQMDEGLPQSSVTSIVQTRDGYLWVGTFGGLARFDGVRFKIFDPNNAPGLTSSRIVLLFEDRSEALWMATEEGFLVKCAGGRFDAYIPPNLGTLVKHVKMFAETDDRALWMSTAEGLLIRFAAGQFTVPSTNWNLQGTMVSGVVTDSSGQLWVGSEKELAIWRDEGFKAVWDRTREEGFGVEALVASRAGGCWVAGNGRLRRFDDDKWVADYGAYRWSKGVVNYLQEDRYGQVWIGTYGGGLFRYETNGAVLHLSRKEGLPGDSVRSLCEDREGNIWVGMEGGGLARLKQTAFHSYGRRQGLSGDSVLSICEGQEGELWIGTNGDGVDRLKDGLVQHYGPNEGLTNECVWSVFQDRDKTLWAGTWGSGLFKLERERFVPFTDTSAAIVCGIFEDSEGSLWLGQQMSEPAITRLRKGKPTRFTLPSGLPYANVRVITEDRSGNLWIGTHDDGLYRITGGQVARIGKRDGLSSERIRSLYADAEGVLWIGTSLGGLNRMQGEKCTAFTTRDGLVDDVILHIAEDGRDNLWCSSGNGVFRVGKSELEQFACGQRRSIHCVAFTKADGLPSMEFSGGCQPSGCKTRDGRLWFPTVNGMAVVDPTKVPFNSLPPPVVIEEVLIEGKVQGLDDRPADIIAGRSAALKVAPGRQRFEFHYAGLSFTAPEKVRFKYKLQGLEKDWVEAGTRRAAIYSYLRPGDYRFRVLACNNDGVWNEKGDSLAMTILPHFWQTWWFRLLGAITLILLFVAAYEIRLASERRLARLRLRIARDLHDEVGSNVGSIALLSEVMSKQFTTATEELSEIRRIAVQTLDSLRDIVWFLDPGGDNLGDLILRMKDTAKAMLTGVPFDFRSEGAIGSAVPSLELRRNLFPIFKEILHNITKHSRAGRVEIGVEVAPRQFQLRISDDGVGFDESGVRGGNGLKNLRRRAAELGGAVEIQSRAGGGTTVTLRAPITQTREIRGLKRVLNWIKIPK